MSRRSAGTAGGSDPTPAGPVDPAASSYPGANLGLPATGRGSIAPWLARITALVLDWAVSMIIAVLLFGSGVLTAHDWRAFMTYAVFLVQITVLSALTGSSFGQLLCRTSVVRLDRQQLGWLRAVVRAVMVCLVIPALVIDENRRGLHDLVCGTAVLRKR